MINEIRNNAEKLFNNTGYPTTSNERWKYTDLKNFSSCKDKSDKTKNDIDSSFNIDNCYNIVICNGFVEPIIDSIDGLEIKPYTEIKNSYNENDNFLKISDYDTNSVVAHNTSSFKDALHITISSDIGCPINIINVSNELEANNIFFPRIYIHAKSDTKSKIFLQNHNINSSCAINSVTEIYLEENSEVEVLQVSDIDNHEMIDSIYLYQETKSKMNFLSATFGGKLYRSNINIDIKGSDCENTSGILILGRDKDHIDYHTDINHHSAHSVSDVLCRSLLKDHSNGIFNGKIFVSNGAGGTDATLNNNNLLLSEKAEIQSNPQLEINCEDVKCSHGSTSGNLDKEAIFYLRSRGISESEANDILINGFLTQLLSKFNCGPINLERKIEEWIQK